MFILSLNISAYYFAEASAAVWTELSHSKEQELSKAIVSALQPLLTFDQPLPPQFSNQFCQHFCMLKEEVLMAIGLHALATLAQELLTAAHKYFTIKKLFWEVSTK